MKFYLLLALATLTIAAPPPLEEASRRACAYTCGSVCYTSSAVNAAQQQGYSYYSEGEQVGRDNYPHKYNDYEGFDFPVSAPYYEFPIMRNGDLYDGGSPGADRVIFNGDDELVGVITHSGAGGDSFVSC